MKQHVRGSAVMLLGRGVGVLLNLAVQVLLVRALAVAEYGSFAFGLSIAAIGATTVAIGLDKGISRFVAIHEERREFAEMAGVILLGLGLVFTTGITAVGLFFLMSPWFGLLVPPDLSLSVLLILVCLAPAEALDRIMIQLLTIFASAKTVAVRRFVVLPSLRLIAVGAVLFLGQSVIFLAYAWLSAVLISLTISALIVWRIFRDRALLDWFRSGSIRILPRPLLRFSIPLTSSDIAHVVRGHLVVFMLGVIQAASAVASYRAVLPLARLNVFVSDCFRTLFLPAAGKLCARNDKVGLGEFYWQTCTWILVLSFPVFIVTFTLAEELSVLLFGGRYAESGEVLRWLSLAFFMTAVLGNTTLTLQQVSGQVRNIVVVDALTLVFALVSNLILITAYSAIGGAMANLLTTAVRTVAAQWLLKSSQLVGRPSPTFERVTMTSLAMIAGVLAFQALFSPGLGMQIAILVTVVCVVTMHGVRELDLLSTFPELARVPLLRQLAANG